MSDQFDDLCKSLAAPKSRREAIKMATTALLAGAATILVPASAWAARRQRRVASRRLAREDFILRPGGCIPGEVDCGFQLVNNQRVPLCCSNGQSCCIGCCPGGYSKCCFGDAPVLTGCCPTDGDCAGWDEDNRPLCCPAGSRICSDPTFTCCPKNMVCVYDQAILGTPGCCPPLSNGDGLLCGGVCCKEGEECSREHKQCRKKRGPND